MGLMPLINHDVAAPGHNLFHAACASLGESRGWRCRVHFGKPCGGRVKLLRWPCGRLTSAEYTVVRRPTAVLRNPKNESPSRETAQKTFCMQPQNLPCNVIDIAHRACFLTQGY